MGNVTTLTHNPLTAQRDALDRVELLKLFSALKATEDTRILGLRPYLKMAPQVWFDRSTYASFLRWLKMHHANRREKLLTVLQSYDMDLNKAFLFLREINYAAWHEDTFDTAADLDLVRLVDRVFHPAYLRLVEAVLIPFVRVVAHFSRMERGAGTEGLDVWPVVDELRRGPMHSLVGSYDHLLRNAIAHGGVTYLPNEIRYRDKKGNEQTCLIRETIRKTDDLVDCCNGLGAALQVFLITVREHQYPIPRELLVEELREETRAPWWIVEGCVEAAIADRSQLLMYAHANSRDTSKVQGSAIWTGILAESLVPGYDRYFISLRSDLASVGWAAFDGARMKLARESDPKDISAYRGVLENDAVFYRPRRPLGRLGRKLDTLRYAFEAVWPRYLSEVHENLGIPQIRCRKSTMHRNAWGMVINGSVVVPDWKEGEAREQIHRFRRRILRVARRESVLATGTFPLARCLPVAFARISVYRRDYRPRRLSGFGLGEDLICTVQFQRMKRIRSPDIMGSTVEVSGKWRVAWNKAWLEHMASK